MGYRKHSQSHGKTKEAEERQTRNGKKAAAKGVRSLDETGPAIRKPVKNINLQDTDDFEKFTPLDEEEFDNFEGYYSDDDYDMFGSNDYDYDDDELFDATADLLSNHPERREVMRRWMTHLRWMLLIWINY